MTRWGRLLVGDEVAGGQFSRVVRGLVLVGGTGLRPADVQHLDLLVLALEVGVVGGHLLDLEQQGFILVLVGQQLFGHLPINLLNFSELFLYTIPFLLKFPDFSIK